MEFVEWGPLYDAIVADLGFSKADDRAAALLLAAALRDRDGGGETKAKVLESIRQKVEGHPAIIIGAGHPVEAGEIRAVLARHDAQGAVVLYADKAVHDPVPPSGLPIVAIVTDLDGDIPLLARWNDHGVPLCVHAHGDNVEALTRWLPSLKGPLVGTTQGPPVGELLNAGGFTDGDRACFLAESWGATRLLLVGFDLEHASTERKRRKLAWAKRLLPHLRVPWEIVPAPSS